MIVVRSRVAVILPEIPQGRRTSPWRRWSYEDEPSVDERILTIAAKRELSREAHNMVNTPHIYKTWCTTKYDAWQRLHEATHGKRWCIQEQHIKARLNEAETTYNNSGKSSYATFEIGSDLNKPYVQVVKQQVKMHKDDLHEILVKLHIKFI